jgi:DNA/RNA endonuclease YhcR with UshA esterase domain
MRLSLRALYWGAAILASVGLLLVWFVARDATVPTVQARDIGDTANWAFVRLHGVVVRYPAYDEDSGYLGFWIDDGSGEVLVAAYRGTSQALVSTGNVPAIGDVISAQGTLRVKQDSSSLVLNAPGHLVIERTAPVEVSIDRITGRVHDKVQVRGQVREVREPYQGFVVIHIRDETGGVDVIYDQDLVRLSGAPIEVLPGDAVSARGAVTLYKGMAQISLDQASGLQRLREELAIAGHREIAGIGPEDVDRWIRVRGVVTDERVLSAGTRLVLADKTGEIALVLWANVLDSVAERVAIREGTWLDVQGLVAEYRGELEVIPELACDVRVLSMVSTPDAMTGTPPATAVALRSPAATAVVTATHVASPGPAPTLMPSPTPGRTLSAVPGPTESGVSPSTPAAMSTRAPTATLAATMTPTPGPSLERSLSAMSTGVLATAHLGQEVTVRGQIVEATQFASGVRSRVDDGSGPVVVWMPQAIYEGLADGMEWRVGSTVRVTGWVDQYEGEIEVVPQAARDVAIVHAAAVPSERDAPIGDLNAGRAGERVTVEARIVAVEPFSSGVKVLLDDGSGQIALLLWQSVYDAVPGRGQLAIGAVVRVTGVVQEYRGALELVPGMGTDVVVIPRG